MKCWGRNVEGQLGQGDVEYRGDDPNEMGSYLSPIDLGSGVLVSAIEIGGFHVGIITDSGQIKIWGGGPQGQLGYENGEGRGDEFGEMGDYLPFVNVGSGRITIEMSFGLYTSCLLLDNKDLKCIGWNAQGALGQGHTMDLGNGPNQMGDYLPALSFPSGVIIDKIGSGWYHHGIISTTGIFYLWGDGEGGKLGSGSTEDIGDDPYDMGNNISSVNVGTGRATLEFQGGYRHSCMILDNFGLKCFGLNDNGQLGYGDINYRGNNPYDMGDNLTYVDMGSGLNAISVHGGELHTCAILNNDQMKCWGRSDSGQIGNPQSGSLGNEAGEMGDYLPTVNLGSGVEVEFCFDYSPTVSPTPYIFPQVACKSVVSSDHQCIISTQGSVKCWGGNDNGQLGYGHTNKVGDELGELGEYLPEVDIGTGITTITLATANQQSCAVFDNTMMKCWGENIQGSLGLGNSLSKGDEIGEMGDYLSFLDLGSIDGVSSVKCFFQGCCALINWESIKCWGDGEFGATGLETASDIGDGPAEMGDNLPFVNFGSNLKALSLGGGTIHNCVLTQTFQMKCWGLNDNGQLGQDHTADLGDDGNEMGDYLPFINLGSNFSSIVEISKSGRSLHQCAISSIGHLKCWGDNMYGQLGQGHTEDMGDNTSETQNMSSIDLGAGLSPIEVAAGHSHTVFMTVLLLVIFFFCV